MLKADRRRELRFAVAFSLTWQNALFQNGCARIFTFFAVHGGGGE
jgi:hypothetical protein